MKNYPLFFLLGGLLICAFLADIAIGSVNLSLSDVWATLTGNSDNLIYHEIILNHRLPKAITAILAGGALSVAGVLMQTLFHNPLAGPDVLGVTSGASLGVALLTLGTSTLPLWLITGWGQGYGCYYRSSMCTIVGYNRVHSHTADCFFVNNRHDVRLFCRSNSKYSAKHEQSGHTETIHYLDIR